jgi:hypothetical protein
MALGLRFSWASLIQPDGHVAWSNEQNGCWDRCFRCDLGQTALLSAPPQKRTPMSVLGHSLPGRASSKSGHVRYVAGSRNEFRVSYACLLTIRVTADKSGDITGPSAPSVSVRMPREVIGPQINCDRRQAQADADPKHRRMMNPSPITWFARGFHSVTIRGSSPGMILSANGQHQVNRPGESN